MHLGKMSTARIPARG